ncbi:MAG: gliding motility-associated-like protein [Limisphaerales bacterium]|jgi:gliding motility-associated-like protein
MQILKQREILRKALVSLITLLISVIAIGQNLVLNPGFENFTVCPNSIDQVNYATGWDRASDGTSDYFNGCSAVNTVSVPDNGFGFAYPFEGNGYAGIVTYVDSEFASIFINYREYLTGTLVDPLNAGQLYKVSIKVQMAEGFEYATNSFGAYFSALPPALPSTGINWPVLSLPPYNMEPQADMSTISVVSDTSVWLTLTSFFTAEGGEQYITIGNFKTDDATTKSSVNPASSGLAYYYVDYVEVEDAFAPIAIDDVADIDENSSQFIDVLSNDSDPDGTLDPATMALVSAPSFGSLNYDDGTGEFLYESNTGFSGTDEFVYRICDNEGLCDEAIVTLYISGEEDSVIISEPEPTLCVDDFLQAGAVFTTSIAILNNDTPGSGVFNLSSIDLIQPETGEEIYFSAESGEVFITSKPQSSEVTFYYEICDTKGQCDGAKVTVIFNFEQATIFIPQIFTPNGDGYNDRFEISGVPAQNSAELYIFNRWERQVYYSPAYENNWDGNALPVGTYYYVFKTASGTFNPKSYVGAVTITR